MELSRRRRIGIWSLIVAGAIVAVLSIFAIWTARQLLNGDNWEKTNSALIADEDVQVALSNYLVDQLYVSVDLSATLQEVLPPRLDVLAGPAAGALREPLVEAVQKLLDAPRVQALWAQAARVTHDQFVNLIEERGTALRTPSGGGVVLDVRPIIGAVGEQLGLPITGERLPEDVGRIVILQPEQLDAMQKAVKLLKTLAIVLFLLAIILLGVAVWLAKGRRREMLATAALSVVIASILVLLLRRIVGEAVIGDIAATPTVQAAADAVWTIGTSLLAQIARTLLLLALLLVISVWLAGPSTWAAKLRGRARPALVAKPELVHGTLLALLLGLLALGVIPGIRTLAAALLLIIVVVGGVEMVRRQAVSEAI